MVSQLVFQDKKEIERLKKQRNLLLKYEKPVIEKILAAEWDSLSVLDVGCNEGEKTVSLFSSKKVRKVIGLEYNKDLAQEAEKERGDSRFTFFNLDVESDDFLSSLGEIMKKENVAGFDIIYLSFVLMHLKNPDALLLKLKDLLNADGTLIVVESDDSSSFICPDDKGLMKEFMAILEKDKYSGNRTLGRTIERRLIACGYNITRPVNAILVSDVEREKRDDVYTVFFSYLEDDVDILLKEEKDNKEYKAWKQWLDENSPMLEKLIKDEDSRISMGLKILVCHKGLDKNA